MAEKIYFVRETQFGYTVEGPNGHKWQSTREDGWQRTVAMAKALERAYLEGQKSISGNMDLLVTFELIKTLGEDTDTSLEDLRSRIRLIRTKAEKVVAGLEEARTANLRDKAYRPGDSTDSSEERTDANGPQSRTRPPRAGRV